GAGGDVLQGGGEGRRPAAGDSHVPTVTRPPAAATGPGRNDRTRSRTLSCNETRELLHAYVDGELDLAHALAVERHLDDCPACVRARDELLALRALVQSAAPRFRAPDSLYRRVQEAPSLPRPAPRRVFAWRRYVLPFTIAASLALVFALGWLAA